MRHSIFFVLYFFAALPHVFETPLWVFAVAIVIATHAYLALSGRTKLLNSKVTGAISLAALGYVYYQFKTVLGVEPATALLLILAALKLEELRTERDGYIFLFLLTLIVMYYLLFSQTLLSTLYMLVMCIAITVGFIAFNTPRQHFKKIMQSSPKLVGKDLLISLPIFFVMFFSFPRFASPWASFINDPRAQVGFAEDLEPGEMAELAQSKEPAFFVTFQKNKIPPINQLYWRGVTLEVTDGWRWMQRTDQQMTPVARLAPGQEPPDDTHTLLYRIQIQPRYNKQLFSLESTSRMQWSESQMYNPIRRRDDISFKSDYPVVTRLQYEGWAALQDNIPEELSKDEQTDFLKVPQPSEKMAELVARFREQSKNPKMLADMALNYFAENGFQYSLSTPQMKTVDDFMFDKKVGFCEHFASAFALIMRWAGVPSRVIFGFQGGELNEFADFILVRDQHAHAWTEIYNGKTWLRVDPTSAVNSVRLSLGSLDQALPGETGHGTGAVWYYIARSQMIMGALEQKYNQFLMNYNFDAQEDIFNWAFNIKAKRWLMFLATLMSVAVLFFVMQRLQSRRSMGDPVRLVYDSLQLDLSTLGVLVRPSDGPRTLLNKAIAHWPDAATELRAVFGFYISYKYETISPSNRYKNTSATDSVDAPKTVAFPPTQAARILKNSWLKAKPKLVRQKTA